MRSWLRQIRIIKNMTEAQTAAEAGISQPFYHWVETGKKNPSPAVAQAIADVLGFDWTLFYPRKDRKVS